MLPFSPSSDIASITFAAAWSGVPTWNKTQARSRGASSAVVSCGSQVACCFVAAAGAPPARIRPLAGRSRGFARHPSFRVGGREGMVPLADALMDLQVVGIEPVPAAVLLAAQQ